MKSNGLIAIWLTLCATVMPTISSAQTLAANANNSRLTFSGEHAGMAFSGIFGQWEAELTLPPAPSPSITAQFSLASAKTGNRTYDGTLPEADWFDVKRHPQAHFHATEIVANADASRFDVNGTFTLKGITHPLQFILHKSMTNDRPSYTATFSIDRLAYDIGRESDPDAEWVSQAIDMSLTINQ